MLQTHALGQCSFRVSQTADIQKHTSCERGTPGGEMGPRKGVPGGEMGPRYLQVLSSR